MNKVADLYFVIPPIYVYWDSNNCENLAVAIVIPFLPFRPWQLKGTPKMLSMGRELCNLFKEKNMDTGNILHRFVLFNGQFPTMSPNVVWIMLYFGKGLPFSHSLSSDPWAHKGTRVRDGGREN